MASYLKDPLSRFTSKISVRFTTAAIAAGLLAFHVPWCGLDNFSPDPPSRNPTQAVQGGNCCCAHAGDGGAPADPGGPSKSDPCCPGGCKSCPRACCTGVTLAASQSSQAFTLDDGSHGTVIQGEPQLQSIAAARVFHPPRA